MDDPNTARQNGAEGLERSEKLPATSGKRGQKIYGRDALTNGSKTLPDTDGGSGSPGASGELPTPCWRIRAVPPSVRNRVGS